MDCEWDERKRRANIQKHGFDFVRVTKLFNGPHLSAAARTSIEEERWLAIGMIDGLLATVIFTQRQGGRRIISVRRARHDE